MKKTIDQVIDYIETVAPRNLQASWDHTGLMLGDVRNEAKRILFTLDVTPDTVREAIDKKASLIVSHHPFFFKPINRIDLTTSQGRMIEQLLVNDIAVYSAHSNYDAAAEGVNDVFADLLNLKNRERIEKNYLKASKLLFYVEAKDRQPLIERLFLAGGGGAHQEASYVPVQMNRSDRKASTQDRVEMLVDGQFIEGVVKVLATYDPEKKIRYDLISLDDRPSDLGLGIVGDLPSSMTLETLVKELGTLLDISHIRVVGHNNHIVARVAVCGGAGKSLIEKAAHMGAQVMITGDIDYHSALDAQALNMMVIDATHYATEKPAMVVLAESVAMAMEIPCEFSETSKDVIHVIE